jgi:hypothetical protein
MSKKNPAAVALGKLRHEKRPEQEQRFFEAKRKADARRTAAERSAIARKSAMTKRLAGPPWLRKSNSAAAAPIAETPPPADAPPLELPPDLAQLSRAIDDMPDDLLETLLDALARRPA